MKQKCNKYPHKLNKEEIAIAPIQWRRTLDNYSDIRRKAIRENKPGLYTLIIALSISIIKKNRYLIDEAIELTKENIPEHVYLSLAGSTLCDLGFKEEGLPMLRSAVEINPTHELLSSLATNTDDTEEKENLSNRVLAENPKDCDALRHLAFAKYAKGKKVEAEKLLDKILEIEPSNVFALENKGNSYFNNKKYNKALEEYLKIGIKPKPISLQYKICHCYYMLGNHKKARKTAKRIKNKISLAYDLDCDVDKAQNLLNKILNA